MESRSKILGHALHPMLVTFPIELLITGTFFDIAGMVSGYAAWHQAAYWMIGVGVVMGLVAAIPGFIDWLAIPMGTRAKAVGILHAVLNVALLAVFAIAWLMRRGESSLLDPGWMPIVLQIVGLGIGSVSAWLGGELVERLGVGVDSGANLNSPSSLSGRPATDTAEPPISTGRPIKARG